LRAYRRTGDSLSGFKKSSWGETGVKKKGNPKGKKWGLREKGETPGGVLNWNKKMSRFLEKKGGSVEGNRKKGEEQLHRWEMKQHRLLGGAVNVRNREGDEKLIEKS